jgi:acyl-CoA synthetase (AMP-forming)/AMP-acid ligase II
MHTLTTPPEATFRTVAALIRAHAQRQPERPALRDDQHELNYAQLDALMDRIAAALQRDGLQPGDSIAICAHSSVQYAALFLGALRAGVVVAPLAPSANRESLASMLQDAGAQWLFLDSAAQDLVPPGMAASR